MPRIGLSKILAGTNRTTAPLADELELSLFGPGYGECLVVHMGNGDWFITDSCINQESGQSIALDYLDILKVSPATSVKAVIASHWHDDHTRGLAGVVKACSKASIICTEAVKSRDFVTLARAAGQRAMMSTSGITEFAKVLDVLLERKKAKLPDVSWATSNKTLLRIPSTNGIPEIVFTSLSPSDAALTRSNLEIARLIPTESSEKRRIGVPKTNNTSIVLLLQVGAESILLGSDLEVTADKTDGWTAILDDKAKPVTQSACYKVAHHGSETGNDPRIWADLLTNPRWAVLTPFVNGDVALPTKQDAQNICEHTPYSFIASLPRRAKPKRRDAAVERTLKETVLSITNSEPQMGHVRLRKQIGASEDWRVELFDAARPLGELTA